MRRVLAVTFCTLCFHASADVALTYEMSDNGPSELRYFYTLQIKDERVTFTTSVSASGRVIVLEDNSLAVLNVADTTYTIVPIDVSPLEGKPAPDEVTLHSVDGVACRRFPIFHDGEEIGTRCVGSASKMGMGADDIKTLRQYAAVVRGIADMFEIVPLDVMGGQGDVLVAQSQTIGETTSNIRLKNVSLATLNANMFSIPEHYKDLSSSNYVRGLEHLARSGDAEAKFKTANTYMSNKVVERDVGRAVYWYRLAVDEGHRDAAIELSILYEENNDLSRDLAKALFYAKVALALTDGRDGPELAIAKPALQDQIDYVVSLSTLAQQKDADALFREWLANR
ncbi:MAG: tetratricopeptide repeat protein [Gammaproteobacteria bacterium]